MENRYIDPRYRSSGKLGSEQWMAEREEGTGSFPENRGMSWKTALISVAVIAAVVMLVLLIAEPFMTVY